MYLEVYVKMRSMIFQSHRYTLHTKCREVTRINKKNNENQFKPVIIFSYCCNNANDSSAYISYCIEEKIRKKIKRNYIKGEIKAYKKFL